MKRLPALKDANRERRLFANRVLVAACNFPLPSVPTSELVSPSMLSELPLRMVTLTLVNSQYAPPE